jgi:hypothetical protein
VWLAAAIATAGVTVAHGELLPQKYISGRHHSGALFFLADRCLQSRRRWLLMYSFSVLWRNCFAVPPLMCDQLTKVVVVVMAVLNDHNGTHIEQVSRPETRRCPLP